MNSWKPEKDKTFGLVISTVVKGSGCQINGLSKVDLGLTAAVLSNSHRLAVINAGTSKQKINCVPAKKTEYNNTGNNRIS